MVSIEWKSHLAPPSKGELHGALHKKQKVVQPSGSHQTQNVSRHSPFETIIAISCAFQGLPKDCQSCWCPGRGVAFWKFLKKKNGWHESGRSANGCMEQHPAACIPFTLPYLSCCFKNFRWGRSECLWRTSSHNKNRFKFEPASENDDS